ncbi:preprotein translocase subunit SecE [Haematomicrobium sanguinis]|uniref:preprotein translocase subunit SecE n=1 Tax=Haematomicrobium sanguinis TaxID=479106 RepID=UPI00047966BC|nr:preprotein translocase subunit SecE [Haematomicrobium sanguinis]
MSDTAAGSTQERGKKSEKKSGLFARIALFLRQVVAELRKVVTPTRQELVRYTLVVIAFVMIMMLIVWGLDTLFGLMSTYLFGIGGSI